MGHVTEFVPGTLAHAWYARGLSYPETSATGVCTRMAIKVRKKGFVFIGVKLNGDDVIEHNALIKISASLEEANALAAEHPGRYQVGKHGWVTVRMAPDEAPPEGLMARWIDEAYRIAAPKAVLKQLDG